MVLTWGREKLQNYSCIATRMIFYCLWEGTAPARTLGWGVMPMPHPASSNSLRVLLIHSDCLQLNHVTVHSLKRFKYVLAGSHRFNSTICCMTVWRDILSYPHFCLTFLPNILLLFWICICAFRQAGIGTGNWMIFLSWCFKLHYTYFPFFLSHSFLATFIYIWMELYFLSCNFFLFFIFLSYLKKCLWTRMHYNSDSLKT